MKSSYIIRCLFCIFILLSGQFTATAQKNSCGESLYKASRLYEQGHFQEAVNMLEPCVHQVSRDIRFEAYRLLSICYINLNELRKAESAAAMLLLYKPSYKEFPYVDPAELSKILGNYTVRNLVDAGIKTGFSINSVHLRQYYAATNSSASFNPKAGYEAGLTLNYHFLPRFAATIEILYAGLNYVQQSDDVNGWNMRYQEGVDYFSFPLLLKYDAYTWKKQKICFEAGGQLQLLSRTHSSLRFDNAATGESMETAMDYYSGRTSLIYGLVAGIQLRKQLPAGIFGAEIRYEYGLKNIVNPAKRYDNLDFISNWRYLYSDISFNTFCLSLSYELPVKYAVGKRKK